MTALMRAKGSIFVAEDHDQIRGGDGWQRQESKLKLKPLVEAVLRRVIGTEQGIESFARLGRRHNLGRATSEER